uniref:DRMBL domain-containing protein n=1 Tax=Strongyloides venezuelensis TaxID=75913 RepID=A0A0K0F1I7_STRVS
MPCICVSLVVWIIVDEDIPKDVLSDWVKKNNISLIGISESTEAIAFNLDYPPKIGNICAFKLRNLQIAYCVEKEIRHEDRICIGFPKSYHYDNFALKLIQTMCFDRNVFDAIICPGPTWLTKFSNSQYIETSENFLVKLKIGEHSNIYTLKYMYCHGIGVKISFKCGYLEEMFVSSIDVGYECDDNDNEENKSFRNMGREYYFLLLQVPKNMQRFCDNSSSSTSSSISSSQSTTNSTAVVSEVTNIPILQDKNVAAKSTNMGKNVVSKNANISNKVTNPGQKVDAKNSNPKLINQVKIAPKKVVGKNSNPKKISNMDDSVFKVK